MQFYTFFFFKVGFPLNFIFSASHGKKPSSIVSETRLVIFRKEETRFLSSHSAQPCPFSHPPFIIIDTVC